MSDEVTRNAGGGAGDDVYEMIRRNRLDDRAADALFSGRVPPGREDLADVAGFAEALRSAASEAPEPSPDLAAILASGLSTDKGDLPAMAGSNVQGPAPQAGLPKWRIKKMLEIALAKLASLGLAAKIGVASAAVVAGTAGAGAGGLLPGAVQDAVAGTVEAVTPFDLPDSGDVDLEEVADPAENDHGQTVSETARTTDAEGCERGHEIATTAGGDPEDCVEETEEGEVETESRPEEPGDEGRTTADTNAGDNGQEGRDTADDAATNQRTYGESKASENQRTGEDASTGGQQTGEEARTERQQTGEDASAEGQQTGEDASAEGQETGEDASAEGQETGDTASAEGQERGDSSRADGQSVGDEAAGDNRP